MIKAVKLDKKNNIIIVFDVCYRNYTWKNKDEIAVYYSTVAKASDIIIGSREEFDLTEGLISNNTTDAETDKRQLEYGNKIVVIKHGKEGYTAYTRDGNSSIESQLF